MKKYFLLYLLTSLFYSTSFFAQGSTSVKAINPSEGLNKGFYAFSVGVNFGQYTSKNEDAFFYYIQDEKNIKYNVKVGFSYNIKDNSA